MKVISDKGYEPLKNSEVKKPMPYGKREFKYSSSKRISRNSMI